MSYQMRGYRLSLVVHAFFLFSFVILSYSGIHATKPVEINFSIENSSASDGFRTSPSHGCNETKERETVPLKSRTVSVKPKQIYPKAAPYQAAETSETATESLISADTEPVDSYARPVEGDETAVPDSTEPDVSSSGQGIKNSEEMNKEYLKEHFMYIRVLVQKRLSYPRIARQLGWEGKVIIAFIVGFDGLAKDIKIRESSGIELLDRNAITAVRDASPFPKPPIEARLVIPINYKLE